MWSVTIKFGIIGLYNKKFHTTYIHTYIRTYISMYICVYIHIYIHAHIYNNLHLNCTHTNKREYMFTLNLYSKEGLFAPPRGLNLDTPNIATQIFKKKSLEVGCSIASGSESFCFVLCVCVCVFAKWKWVVDELFNTLCYNISI